ncbi:amino acid ABC transporter substrate-binding protein, partial [Pseudomonas sp. AL03]|nr:amino acid ABC transporter substrate-binding protein [Pseudomonas sp. AL03]
MKVSKIAVVAITVTSFFGVGSAAVAGPTLDAIQRKGFVQCGVSDGLPGFSVP